MTILSEHAKDEHLTASVHPSVMVWNLQARRHSPPTRIRYKGSDQRGHLSDKIIRRRTFLTGAAASPLAAAAQRMKLAIRCDHAGFSLTGPVLELLHSWGYTVKDCGTFSTNPVDFPDIAQKVTAEVLSGRAERAIMVWHSALVIRGFGLMDGLSEPINPSMGAAASGGSGMGVYNSRTTTAQ